MKLPFALWYIRNGHIIAHPSTNKTDKKGTCYVYMMTEDTFQLLYFITTIDEMIAQCKKYGEMGYKNRIIRKNLAYVASEFPLYPYGWTAPMQYSNFKEYEKLQRKIADKELNRKKEYGRGRIPETLYLEEILSILMNCKNRVSIKRAFIDRDYEEEEFVKLQFYSFEGTDSIRICVGSNRRERYQKMIGVTSRDIIFRWRMQSIKEGARK